VTHDIESCDCGHPVNSAITTALCSEKQSASRVLMGYEIMNTCVPLSRSWSTFLGFRLLL
jgi:hypothetical protein